MFIAISGPSGSGKTTLINKYQELHPEVKLIDRKSARSILADMNMTLEDVYKSVVEQKHFQMAILKRKYTDEQIAIDSSHIYLVDRSYADLFAYVVAYMGRHNNLSGWVNIYYDRCRSYQSSYDGVIYIDGGKFKIEDDGVRPTNAHYAKMIGDFTNASAMQMGVTVSKITESGLDERVESMDKIINSIRGNKT